MTVRISSVVIASRCTSMFGFWFSNPWMMSCTALSRAVVSVVSPRNLTVSPRLPPQPAAPKNATPASPTPPSLRKSLRLTALGICCSPTLAKRLSIEAYLVALYDSSYVGHDAPDHFRRRIECAEDGGEHYSKDR